MASAFGVAVVTFWAELSYSLDWAELCVFILYHGGSGGALAIIYTIVKLIDFNINSIDQ
jgi:hypothetical protein